MYYLGITTKNNPCIQDRTDGRSPVREIHTYTCTCTNTNPCLQNHTDGRSPVREIHTCTYKHKHKSLPTRPHRWQIAGQGDTYMYIQTQIPAYKTAQMADRRSGRYMYIQTQIPAYKTAQMADRRSGRYIHTNTNPCLQDRTDSRSPVREIHVHTNTNPCLQDRTDGRSPVREIHTYKHKSLPTRPHRWQIAGQGDTYIQTQIPAYKTAQMADRRSGRYIHVHTNTNPCLQDRTDGRSPVREIHTCTYKHKSLPTRPHRWQIAGQGDTYMYIQTQIPAYKTAQRVGRRSGRYNVHVHTYMYKHKSLPTRPHRWQVAGQGGTHTYNYIHVHAQYMNPQPTRPHR